MPEAFLSLPPLNALRAFEASARHLNFRIAAEELNVTQGAVARTFAAWRPISARNCSSGCRAAWR